MILLFLVFFCLCIDPVASQQTQEQLQLPSPLFAIVDVETTGLNPSFNEMIDIGLILVNTDLQEQGRFYRKIHPTYPHRIHPIAKQINGYDPVRWKKHNALLEEEAVHQLIAFLNQYEQKPIFIAFNSWFDAGFVSSLFREYGQKFDASFDYRVMDIPSMARACGYSAGSSNFNDNLAKMLAVEPETNNPLLHTGESGANFNLAILKSLQKKGCF